MTACCTELSAPAHLGDRFDILRGAGLAVSVTVILVLPAALAVIALIRG